MSGAYLPILLRIQLQQTYGYAVILPAIIVKILELEFAYVSDILLGAPIILELESARIAIAESLNCFSFSVCQFRGRVELGVFAYLLIPHSSGVSHILISHSHPHLLSAWVMIVGELASPA